MITRKRRFIELFITPAIGFVGSVNFLQFYKEIQKKFDPVMMLINCLNHPTTKCKPPLNIQKERNFIEKAKKIVVEEMPLKLSWFLFYVKKL